jgi:hypothetical protein
MKAFPHNEEGMRDFQPGMDLRDYFAAKALQALIITNNKKDIYIDEFFVSEIAYKYADAMIVERETT